MKFTLIGFTQDFGFRVFAFEGLGNDQVRTEFTVKADFGLIRRYGIPLQELPLMCRGLLERRNEAQEKRMLTFTEDEICLYARQREAARDAAFEEEKTATEASQREYRSCLAGSTLIAGSFQNRAADLKGL